MRIRVCDLADGSAVSSLLLAAPACEERFRTAADGECKVPISIGLKLRPVGEDWRAVGDPVTLEDGETVLWVFRDLNLTGIVTGKSNVKELDPLNVELILVGVGEKGTVVPGRPELSKGWFAYRNLDWRRNLAEVQADGRFQARVPRLPGLVVIAQASGWESVRAQVDWRSDPSSLHLELAKPSLRIRGSLRDEEGFPLPKRRVRAYVTLRMTAEEFYRYRPETRGHGYKSRVHTEKNYAIVTFETMGWTGIDGSFSIESKVGGGELLLLVAPDGDQNIALQRFETLTDDLTGVELIATRCRRPRVRVTERGAPQKSRDLTFLLTSMAEQPSFRVHLDDEGCMPAACLIEGQDYRIRDPKIRLSGWYFRWQGGASLELTDLATRWQDRPR